MSAFRLLASWLIIAIAIPFCILGAFGMLACEVAKDVRGSRP